MVFIEFPLDAPLSGAMKNWLLVLQLAGLDEPVRYVAFLFTRASLDAGG
jgi:hypothetical protein